MSENWKHAIDEELNALQNIKTWSISTLPFGKHSIGCKWVYKLMMNDDGTVECYKAQLVAKGYNQQEGFDYQENFSPVAKQSTVRMFLALSAINGWHMSQFDVNNVFLNGDLDEEVYMDLPHGLDMSQVKGVACEDRLVCRLHKSLYGLKQASRQLNLKFASCLQSYGFQQSKFDRQMETISLSYFFMLMIQQLAVTH